MQNDALQNLNILVTRPFTTSTLLAQKLEEYSANVGVFPCIQIEPLNINHQLEKIQSDVSCIFISKNAVRFSTNNSICRQKLKQVENLYAIGDATAKYLESKINNLVIFPKHPCSEALLELAELSCVKDQKFIIFRGGKGRELIKETLEAKGAEVTYIDCYQRIAPKALQFPEIEAKLRQEQHYDMIVFSSFGALKNAWELLPDPTCLLNTVITVTNERMMRWAKDKGFANMILLKSVKNDDIVKEILEFYKRVR